MRKIIKIHRNEFTQPAIFSHALLKLENTDTTEAAKTPNGNQPLLEHVTCLVSQDVSGPF